MSFEFSSRLVVWAIALLTALGAPAQAHEFWLETTRYKPAAGEEFPVSIHVGQFFKGESYPYLQGEFVSFSLHTGTASTSVRGINGDLPAATLSVSKPGMAVVTYRSIAYDLTFKEWEKFESYLKDQGLETALQRHTAQGKPKTGITEFYERNAKLLIDAGADGQDRNTGMPLEIVAEQNPYRLAAGAPLPVRLYFGGEPLANAQISAFAKADPDKPVKVRTDDMGRAVIPLPHPGAWLLNAVHMIEPPANLKAHWYSYWASLVFRRP